MKSWRVPEGFSGDGDLIRVQPGRVKTLALGCPLRTAVESRPRVRRTSGARMFPTGVLEHRTLNPVNAVLDLMAFSSRSQDEALTSWRSRPKRPFHPALAVWVSQAVRNYQTAAEEVAALPLEGAGTVPGAVTPVARAWARWRGIPGGDGTRRYEEVVHGRRYAADGFRELHLLRISSITNRPVDVAERALAAAVVAGGLPVLSNPWGDDPLATGRDALPDRVRVVEIGCADGSHRVLFDGAVDVAHRLYEKEFGEEPWLRVSGDTPRPGSECGNCPLVDMCPAVPVRPGMLGVEGGNAAGRARRSWSVTTGRTYGKCPAQAHLQDLWLPRDRGAEDSAAVRRGRAVHEWIEERHRQPSQGPCGPADLPGDSHEWTFGQWEVSGSEARLGRQMIGDHAMVCPLKAVPAAGPTDVLPEQCIVVYDPKADTVVVAKTDLLYRSVRGWVLRETKTTREVGASDPFKRYPQLALAVVLAAEGVLPGGAEGSSVEFERLTRTGPVLTTLDHHDPHLLSQARGTLTELVKRWRADETFETRPGGHCTRCPFTRWCPSAEREGAS
ncbi:PD-(D/E)XK nuclease family protein [Streptomyces sp. NPDC017979]|uniref:PD-(D/E)XK nuclease family protein n=1 Tax=Streptomyces sp. NPDC017979 TaxID=3365024 RepID=UPI003791B582